jgi:hypothetical protein
VKTDLGQPHRVLIFFYQKCNFWLEIGSTSLSQVFNLCGECASDSDCGEWLTYWMVCSIGWQIHMISCVDSIEFYTSFFGYVPISRPN